MRQVTYLNAEEYASFKAKIATAVDTARRYAEAGVEKPLSEVLDDYFGNYSGSKLDKTEPGRIILCPQGEQS